MGKKLSDKDICKLFDGGLSAAAIGRKLGYFTTSITRVLKRNGRVIGDKSGVNHPMWKGGVVIKNGYRMLYRNNHARRYNIPYVMEHVLVMEKKLGRVPRSDEPIHHIDLNRLNNDPSNLHLCSGNSDHLKIHSSLDSVARELIRSGVIKFTDGVYHL